MNSVTEASYITNGPVPAIKESDFDGFAGIDVKLKDGTEDKLIVLRGSVDPGAAFFPSTWKCPTISGQKATLQEIAAM